MKRDPECFVRDIIRKPQKMTVCIGSTGFQIGDFPSTVTLFAGGLRGSARGNQDLIQNQGNLCHVQQALNSAKSADQCDAFYTNSSSTS